MSDGVVSAAVNIDFQVGASVPILMQFPDSQLRAIWEHTVEIDSVDYSTTYISDPICWDHTHCPAGYGCNRPFCEAVSNNCQGAPPFPDAVCFGGRWVLAGDLSFAGNTGNGSVSLNVTSNATIIGSLIVYDPSLPAANNTNVTINMSSNSSILVQGCVSLQGSSLAVTLDPTVQSGTNITFIKFDAGVCQGGTSEVDTVTAIRPGAPECESTIATPAYEQTALVVLLTFDNTRCGVSGGIQFELWWLGPIVGGAVFIIALIIIIIWCCRRRTIPIYAATQRMKRIG